MMDIQKAIELLECAEINCDNIRTLGEAGIVLVKMQIQEAIKILDTDDDD
jgi:hypothetical protein